MKSDFEQIKLLGEVSESVYKLSDELVKIKKEVSKVNKTSTQETEKAIKKIERETEEIANIASTLRRDYNALYQNQQELVMQIEATKLNYNQMLDRHDDTKEKVKKIDQVATDSNEKSMNAVQTSNQVLHSLKAIEEELERFKNTLLERVQYTEGLLTSKSVNVQQAMVQYEDEVEDFRKSVSKTISDFQGTISENIKSFRIEIAKLYLSKETFEDWKQNTQIKKQAEQIKALEVKTAQLESREQIKKEDAKAKVAAFWAFIRGVKLKEWIIGFLVIAIVVGSGMGYREQIVEAGKEVLRFLRDANQIKEEVQEAVEEAVE